MSSIGKAQPMTDMKSEIRDGMRIDWDAPDQDGRRRRAARRRVSSRRERHVSGHSQLRSLRQGPVVPGRLQGQLGAADQSGAGSAAGIEQQISELGVDRSGEMGAGRLCLRPRRLARRRPFAGLSRRVVAARDARPLSLHRMGRHAAVEQRQSRHQRHFLLRDEPVDGRRAQAAAPRRAVHLGRRRPTIIASYAATAAS